MSHLDPRLREGRFAFVSLPPEADAAHLLPIATFQEREGLTVVTTEARAIEADLPIRFLAAWLTIGVESPLDAVGWTAAMTTALAEEGIACNVFAAVHHDHLFVPAHLGREAAAALRRLQRPAGVGST